MTPVLGVVHLHIAIQFDRMSLSATRLWPDCSALELDILTFLPTAPVRKRITLYLGAEASRWRVVAAVIADLRYTHEAFHAIPSCSYSVESSKNSCQDLELF